MGLSRGLLSIGKGAGKLALKPILFIPKKIGGAALNVVYTAYALPTVVGPNVETKFEHYDNWLQGGFHTFTNFNFYKDSADRLLLTPLEFYTKIGTNVSEYIEARTDDQEIVAASHLLKTMKPYLSNFKENFSSVPDSIETAAYLVGGFVVASTVPGLFIDGCKGYSRKRKQKKRDSAIENRVRAEVRDDLENRVNTPSSNNSADGILNDMKRYNK